MKCLICHREYESGKEMKAGPSLLAVLLAARGDLPKGTELVILYCGDDQCRQEIETGQWIEAPKK